MHAEYDNIFAKWLYHWLVEQGLSHETAINFKFGILLVGLIIATWLVHFTGRKLVLRVIEALTRRSKTTIDDVLVRNKVFRAVITIIPALVVDYAVPIVFVEFASLIPFIKAGTNIYIIAAIVMLVNALINTAGELLMRLKNFADKPISSYTQLLKIIVYLVAGILIVSIVIGRSPLVLFSAMGAMTAVLLLIFKDTILGFVASIQLASNDMVRLNDWITMEKYGADGDVVEINLATIKVQNFDNTITTIPTYSFISDSFKNWRGMSESGGRRIKRAIHISTTSINFCSEEQIERFKGIERVAGYVEKRQQEIAEYNASEQVNKSEIVNGRHMTNIGVFRAYTLAYIQTHPQIAENMTCMVRQLQTTATGLPLEIYAFSKNQEWAAYEGIMADIFDHLLSAAPEFGLDVFQNASGKDFAGLISK